MILAQHKFLAVGYFHEGRKLTISTKHKPHIQHDENSCFRFLQRAGVLGIVSELTADIHYFAQWKIAQTLT